MSRVFQRKKGEWWIDFKDATGRRRRRKVGPTKRVAQEVLNNLLDKVARRQHLGVIEESSVSFADFAEEWAERIFPTLKPRTVERWRGVIDQHLKPAFRGALRAINREAIESYIARRLTADVSSASVRIELVCLRHLLRRAVDWERLSTYRFAGVKLPKEAPGHTRYLSPEEIEQLLSACASNLYLHAFIIVSLNTGVRRNELLSLTRTAIDWNNRSATLEATKNGDTRHLPLNDTALQALLALPPRLDGRLFPFKPAQLSVAFHRVVKRAGIEDCRLHDLRHTFASYCAMNGVQTRGLQALLGHKDNRMTMRYSHLTDAYLREAVEHLNLGALPTKPPKRGKNGPQVAPTAVNRRG
jgi:integrase